MTAELTSPDRIAISRALPKLHNTFFVSRALYVAAKLGVADLLRDGLRSVDELANATQTHRRTLHRLLRLLASEGIFTETAKGIFATTPLAATLEENAAESVRPAVLLAGDPAQWRAWEDLEYSVRTGLPSFDHVWGQSTFEYYRAHPLGEVFNRAMTQESQRTAPQVVQAYDFSRFDSLVDVGGGQGFQLATILRACPGLRGTLFDLPEVVKTAQTHLDAQEVAERCEIVGGDFFVDVPKDADAYLLRQVLRDWPDEQAVAILRSCRRAAAATSTLLIAEPVIGLGNHATPPERLDLRMQILFAGLVRSLDEFEDILSAADFHLLRAVATAGALTILEASPKT